MYIYIDWYSAQGILIHFNQVPPLSHRALTNLDELCLCWTSNATTVALKLNSEGIKHTRHGRSFHGLQRDAGKKNMFSLLEVVTSMNGSYQVVAPTSRKPLFCCPSLVSQTHMLGGKCPLQDFNTFIKANKKSSVPKLAHKTPFRQKQMVRDW